jgi:hypothetical protein
MPKYCELPEFGLIRYSGDEAGTFLHNQLTCDVNALAPGQSVYGSYCTPKGRVLATFLLWRSAAGYFMQLPSSLREAIQKRLSLYVLRAKVKIEDAGPLWIKAGLSGADAATRIERVLGAVPRQEHDVAFAPDAAVIRLPLDRYEVLAAPDQAQALLQKLKEGTEAAGPEHWDWLDIRAGIPTVTQPTQEQFVPQMVNLDLIGGLSFSKGCYPGQEIVARMHFLGKRKSRMYLVSLGTEPAAEDAPRPGDKLYSAEHGDQASGMIVNAARSPQGGYDALAVLQISGASGAAVRWKSPAGPVLELLPLPYGVTATA